MFRNANEISKTNVLSRTYHIGEYCLYGTVKVAWLDNGKLRIRFYNYKTDKLQEEHIMSFVDKFNIRMMLEDRMSAYYADKIMSDFYA